MPLDVRKLIFSQQELRLAFQTYARDKKLNVPDSHIESVDIIDPQHSSAVTEATSGYTAILNFASNDPNNPYRLHLDEKQILEAMINMCRGLRIPLPRKGQKYLQQHKGSLALTIGLSEQDIRDYMAVNNDATLY